MAQRNGYFQISCRENGTWIVLYPPQTGGEMLNFDMVDEFLGKWQIGYDKKVLYDAISALKERREIRLTQERIQPMNESTKVKISEDRMECILTLFMPAEGGKLMDDNEIVSDLVHEGVKYGLDKERLAKLNAEREYCTPIVIARATPAVEGKNAEIKYYFNTDLTMKPKVLEDGSVDFHSLDTISSVHAGDLLATLSPAIQGKPGIDVCGKQLVPLKVNNKVLRFGKRIHLSPDGLQMFSEVDGHVSLVQDTVFVSDTYEVPADVDSSTGDITYEGNVTVRGSVRTGYKVIAKGDVVVEGVVEGAEIEAGGQIILTHGIQGMSRGRLTADGNIIAKFIESAEVESKNGYVQAEAVMHSKVSAKTEVIVDGKKGFIAGGTIRCGQMITAKTIGSNMGTATDLEVGVDPSLVEEFKRLEKSTSEWVMEKEQLMGQLAVSLKKLKQGEKLPLDKMLWLKNTKQRIEEIDADTSAAEKRLAELDEAMQMKGNGCVKVLRTAYAGCRITIGGAVYHVKSDLARLCFIKEGADVKTTSL